MDMAKNKTGRRGGADDRKMGESIARHKARTAPVLVTLDLARREPASEPACVACGRPSPLLWFGLCPEHMPDLDEFAERTGR